MEDIPKVWSESILIMMEMRWKYFVFEVEYNLIENKKHTQQKGERLP